MATVEQVDQRLDSAFLTDLGLQHQKTQLSGNEFRYDLSFDYSRFWNSGFIADQISRINSLMEPIAPIISFLQTRVPIVSDIQSLLPPVLRAQFNRDSDPSSVTVLEVLAFIANNNGQELDPKEFEPLFRLGTLSQSLQSIPLSSPVPLGYFTVNDLGASSFFRTEVTIPTLNLPPELQIPLFGQPGNQFYSLLTGAGDGSEFDIFSYNLPTLNLTINPAFTFTLPFVAGIAGATIGASGSIDLNLGFGYDAYGLVTTGKPQDGLYLTDFAGSELSISPTLSLGPYAGIPSVAKLDATIDITPPFNFELKGDSGYRPTRDGWTNPFEYSPTAVEISGKVTAEILSRQIYNIGLGGFTLGDLPTDKILAIIRQISDLQSGKIIIQILQDVANEAGKIIESVGTATGEYIESVYSYAGKLLSRVASIRSGEQLVEFAEEIWDDITNNVVVTKIIDGIEEVTNWAGDIVSITQGKQVINYVRGVLSDFTDSDGVKYIYDSLSGGIAKVGGAISSARQWGEDRWESLKRGDIFSLTGDDITRLDIITKYIAIPAIGESNPSLQLTGAPADYKTAPPKPVRDSTDSIYRQDGSLKAVGKDGSDYLEGTSFDDEMDGQSGDDYLAGNNGRDILKGGEGVDILVGGQGDDSIDGGAGEDTAQYSERRLDYSAVINGGTLTLTHKRGGNGDGIDNLTGVELFRFSDGIFSLAEVLNEAPVIQAIRVAPDSSEGSEVLLEIDFTDADINDEHTVTLNWGDPNSTVDTKVTIQRGERTAILKYAYPDDGKTGAAQPGANQTPFDVSSLRITIADQLGNEDTRDVTDAIRVNNLAPTIRSAEYDLPTSGVIVQDDPLSINVVYEDPGRQDFHELHVMWGEGSENRTQLQPLVDKVTGEVYASHAYGDYGRFTATWDLQDDDGGTASQSQVVNVARKVLLDWRPRANPSVLNLNDNGLIRVAVLGSNSGTPLDSTDDFDVRTVSLSSLRFAMSKDVLLNGGGVNGISNQPIIYRDVNGDNIQDLILKIESRQLFDIVPPVAPPASAGSHIYMFGQYGSDMYLFGDQQDSDPIRLVYR